MPLDHARIVLSGIIPNRRDLLLTALQRLQPEHFRTTETRALFQLLESYHGLAQDILPRRMLTDLLERRGTDAGKTLLYEELYDECERTTPLDHEFHYAIDALREQRSRQLTGEALTTAFEILEHGMDVDRRHMRGHVDARDYLLSTISKIDSLNSADTAPEGDIRLDDAEVLREYAERKAGKVTSGILSGVQSIDLSIGGFNPGELIFYAGYTGCGKTQLSCQTAWHAMTQQGKNVFFATSETVRAQVRRRVIARHSRLPKFGLAGGLDVKKIRLATLDPHEEDVLHAVLQDLRHNPDYGKLYVAQIPRGGTLSMVEARMTRQQANWNIDLTVIDYIALLRADRQRQKQQEEYNDLIKDTKVLATTFDSGRGVPIISPWAMGQTHYKAALDKGSYSLGSLAETSEAEKTADGILYMLKFPEVTDRVKCGWLKVRDGDIPPDFTLQVDYRCAYLGAEHAIDMEDILESPL